MARISDRLALAVALLGCACGTLAAPLAACPPSHRENKATAPLESASVFDGAPENEVDVLPDFATLEWDLSKAQEKAKARAESLYLVCKYKGIKATVTLELPPGATLCKAEGIKNRMVVACSAARKDAGTTSQ